MNPYGPGWVRPGNQDGPMMLIGGSLGVVSLVVWVEIFLFLAFVLAALPDASIQGIATIKATLIAVYFMHLRYDKPFNTIVFVSSLLFVGLFLALTLMDLS